MSKQILIDIIKDQANLTGQAASSVANAIIEGIIDELLKSGKFNITGLGVLSIKERKAMIGRNPKTGDIVKVPSRRAITFRMSKTMKARL